MRWFWLVSLVACGGDTLSDNTVEDVCDDTCGRFDECDLFGGYFTLEQCLQQCTADYDVETDPGTEPACRITDREARDCADAWTALSCEELGAGTVPPECDLCPDATGPTDPTDPTDPTGAATCDDLQDCCDQITDPDTQKGCNKTAQSGQDSICALALDGFVLAGLCDR